MIRTKDKEKWEKVSERGYAKESELQKILADSPDLIPIRELGGGRKSIKVAIREAGLPGSGSTDLIGVDEDGNITIVETKLAQNAEIKRKGIGQILEYAAFLWQKSYEEFDEIVFSRTDSHLLDLIENVEKENEEWSVEDFRDAIETNLNDGRFALFSVVDEINEELRRIIDYLNSKNFVDFALYALELKYFQEKGSEVVLPQLYGVANRPSGTAGSRGQKWPEAKFLADAKSKLQPDEFVAVEKLFLFSKKYADDMNLGNGKGVGSINPIFKKFNATNSFFCLKSNGRLGFKIPYALRPDKGADEHQKQRLNTLKQKLEDIGIPVASNDHSVHLTFSGWAPKVDDIIGAMETILKKG